MMNSVAYKIHHYWEKMEKNYNQNVYWRLEEWTKENYQFEWEQYLYENNNVELSSFWCRPTFGFSSDAVMAFSISLEMFDIIIIYHLLLVETETLNTDRYYHNGLKGFNVYTVYMMAALWVFGREFQKLTK